MKTIKELSDDVGISKVSLYKLLKREDIKPHVFKQDNVSVVDEIGENLIRAYYSRERDAAVSDIVNGAVNDGLQIENADIFSFMQEQLQEKDKQISALLNIVANSQKIQGVQLLADNQPVNAVNEPDKPVKRTLFDRIFKRL